MRALLCALAAAAFGWVPCTVSATDHGDSPAVGQDAAADIGDVYFFQDAGDTSQVVLIATVHGFMVPGQMSGIAAFDEDIRYRFQIYNSHVNFLSPALDPDASAALKANFVKGIKPARFIDITFGKRSVGPAPQDNIPANLRRPLAQSATLTFTGFQGLAAKVFRFDLNGDGLQTTPADTSGPAPDFVVSTIQVTSASTASFFAGVVDDPAFFDLPAFISFVDGARVSGIPDAGAFTRHRDTYAGYNTLAIALRLPKDLLLFRAGQPYVGLEFLTQRHATELKSSDGSRGLGAFKTIDRMGSPLANLAFSAFDSKNAYNRGTAQGDARLGADSPLLETLKQLKVDPASPAFNDLGNLYIAYGDLVQVELTPVATLGFPQFGRRPGDDVVDYILTRLNNGTTLSDGVADGGALSPTFPYLGKPNQPLPSGGPEATRN